MEKCGRLHRWLENTGEHFYLGLGVKIARTRTRTCDTKRKVRKNYYFKFEIMFRLVYYYYSFVRPVNLYTFAEEL
jgi:hypothetical protein